MLSSPPTGRYLQDQIKIKHSLENNNTIICQIGLLMFAFQGVKK